MVLYTIMSNRRERSSYFTTGSSMTMVQSWRWCSGVSHHRFTHQPTPLKYSLFYGRPGVREVGYDNERGKGDHRHFQGRETAYAFSSVEQLMSDFWSDVRALRGGK
jgi:hypothetical protein